MQYRIQRNFVWQAEAEKPEQSRQKKYCLAMKTLNLEQMEVVHGGNWLNNHSLKEHLVCVTWGILAETLGPVAVVAAMVACYASFD